MKPEILILDFGSQYTQLIARRLRERGIYTEIVPYFDGLKVAKTKQPKGLIFSGGPASVYEKGAYRVEKEIYRLGLPILAICYGMQLVSVDFGGEVVKATHHEYGKAELFIDQPHLLLENLSNPTTVWMSHSDRVERLPKGFKQIAHTRNAPFAVIVKEDLNIYALQFHPEVTHTAEGGQILENFARKICGVTTHWNMSNFIQEQVAKIRTQVGTRKVISALSGGVDSSVTTALLYKAIGEQLVPIFVDTGLLRKNERAQVEHTFREILQVPLVVVNGEELFLKRLKGVIDPEKKRKIIGHTFIELFEQEAKKYRDAQFLAQGTLYPDVIESVSVKGPSKTIKSHHNVGGLPEEMNLQLIEPLRELFKDEVRRLGLELGLPEELVYRHPFPGPGLAIRIIGEVNKKSLEILREADAIFIEELKKWGLYRQVWQAFGVLLNVQSVGVMGDNRTYENTIALRAVDSTDGMTARFSRLPYQFLEEVATRIINEVEGINRVVYDISSKPPATIEWE